MYAEPVMAHSLFCCWASPTLTKGQAKVECISGCRCACQLCSSEHKRGSVELRSPQIPLRSCNPVEIDLKWENQSTQPSIVRVQVQPVPACRVRLTVLNGTSSGGHRVKLDGVMLNAKIPNELGGTIDAWQGR